MTLFCTLSVVLLCSFFRPLFCHTTPVSPFAQRSLCALCLSLCTLSLSHFQLASSGLSVTLYPYQKQSVLWMLDRERSNKAAWSYLYPQRGHFKDGSSYLYSPMLKRFRFTDESEGARGGMLCEEMGLGRLWNIECFLCVFRVC